MRAYIHMVRFKMCKTMYINIKDNGKNTYSFFLGCGFKLIIMMKYSKYKLENKSYLNSIIPIHSLLLTLDEPHLFLCAYDFVCV